MSSTAQHKPLLLRSLAGEEIERFPVWLMRQAGRFLPEYRELKSRYSFLDLCHEPELSFEVAMMPMARFQPDAAIVFSDILYPVQALGIKLDFNPGPVITNPIHTARDIASLVPTTKTTTLFQSVFKSISALRRELSSEQAVIGFAGSPWTVACYLTSHSRYKHFQGAPIFARQEPEHFHKLLGILTSLTEEYVQGQIEAGADVIQIFDSWGGILDKTLYSILSLDYICKIFNVCKALNTPAILYIGEGSHLLETISARLKGGPNNVISVDWRLSPGLLNERLSDDISIQGNLDPTVLFLPPEQVKTHTYAMVKGFGRSTRYIANLGHGVLPGTPVESVAAFVDTIKGFRL